MVKRCNPGNIRSGDLWMGLTPIQDDSGFCTFIDDVHGIRAMALILHNGFLLGRKTIDAIIKRWAPPTENLTDVYIKNVSEWTGWQADEPLDLADLTKLQNLITAIIHQEQGSVPYTSEMIAQGIALAGI